MLYFYINFKTYANIFINCYYFLENLLKFFILRRFFRPLFIRFFFKKLILANIVKFFKPIFKINFFLNFNFSFKKKIKFVSYKFFRKIKKVLFFFRRFRNLRKDRFYFIFKRRSRVRLRFLFLTKFKWFSYRFRKKRKKRKKRRILNVRKKYRLVWAKNRECMNYFIKFRAIKQFQKTKYFSQFKSKTPYQLFNMFNHNVFSILFFSNIFYSYHQIMFFLKNNFIYKNGIVINTKFITFSLGDRLNIVFSKKYYFYSVFVHFFFFRQLRKLNRQYWKFIKFRFGFGKRSPKNPGKFFEKYIPYYTIQPTFLEFDYKSLTIIYLKSNKNLRNINELYLRYINYYFFRLYNWKYII